MYENCGMGPCANGVEWVKRNMLRWFGHVERKKSGDFVKKVYVSETESSRRRRPVVRWKDRVKKYMHERVADKGEGSVWIGRGGDSSAVAIPWDMFLEGMKHQRL